MRHVLRSVVYGVIVLVLLLLGLRILGAPDPTAHAPLQAAGSGDAVAAPRPSTAVGPDVLALRARTLLYPVEGFPPNTLRDSFAEGRAGHLHEAVDILAPRGTRVLAVDDGRVVKLFNSVRGGLTVYQFDSEQTYCYYYAHLDGYVPWLEEGALVRKGAVLGYVGTTGNAPKDTPHLHFSIFKLGPERRWWEGTPINPFGLWGAR